MSSSKKVRIVRQHIFTPSDCQKNSRSMYVFGDNEAKKGKGGQAVIRGESNAFGIPTLKASGSYYDDINLQSNKNAISKSIDAILHELYIDDKYDTIVFPTDGVGTGLASLSKKAPLTYAYLVKRIKNILRIDNINKIDNDLKRYEKSIRIFLYEERDEEDEDDDEDDGGEY